MKNFLDRFWRDGDGNIVVWQSPNAWLIGWAVLTFVSLLFAGRTADFLTWLASANLIIWALLEIFKGNSYFRRLLGLVVLIYSVLTLIKSL